MARALPRCMFALVGLQSCPGYLARRVAAQTSVWLIHVPAYVTCEHLQPQATERGMTSGCAHPSGLAATWWQTAQATAHGPGPSGTI